MGRFGIDDSHLVKGNTVCDQQWKNSIYSENTNMESLKSRIKWTKSNEQNSIDPTINRYIRIDYTWIGTYLCYQVKKSS